MSANRHCAVIGRTVSLKTASRPSEGFGREYFFSTSQSARGILEPSRTVLDATATKWSLDVAQTTSRLDYQKMETMAESARRVGAVINVTDNVRGELSAHVITVSELNRQKIARAIECDGHDAESVGIIDTTDVVRRDHSLYLTVAKDISSPQARTKSARSPIL